MEIKYQKLLDLEKLKSKALDELLEFQRNNTQKDLLDYKAPDIYQRYLALKSYYSLTFTKWEKYKDNLEKKYNFEFPVECYCSSTNNYLFAEFFKAKQAA